MRLVRFKPEEDNRILWGILDAETITVTEGPAGPRSGESYPLEKVSLLAPAEPSKIVCVGRNYVEHIREMGNDAENLPQEPGLFLKGPNALANPGEKIPYPHFTGEFHYEGELAVVIGSPMKEVPEEETLKGVLGYTIAVDLTARDRQRGDLQWTRGKSGDKFCPLGPWIETELDPFHTRVTTRLNGEIRQDGGTELMIFTVPRILSYITGFMSLQPGDVVLTGTPSGVGEIERGDRIDVTVQGIGTLSITIIDRERS